MTDFYTVLEVAKDADESEIKKAYRRLSKLYHPDTGNQPNADKFREINEAYITLMDPEKRTHYNIGANAQILQLIEQELMGVLAQLGVKALFTDVVQVMKNSFRGKAEQARQTIRDNEAISKQLKQVLAKVKGPGFLQAVLKKHADGVIQHNAINKAQAELMDQCADYLEHYGYNPDTAPSMHATTFGGVSMRFY